ncbi:hypothetical protein OIU84_017991 [Salix udensis]|uniref:Uncharacterized protein n=1 Tax=Salix udensis TaxID=889485 RepID=A0AAD6L3C5_9ROSI|nr:hypothetical protein OIU84_017991 [Salix udensis]
MLCHIGVRLLRIHSWVCHRLAHYHPRIPDLRCMWMWHIAVRECINRPSNRNCSSWD